MEANVENKATDFNKQYNDLANDLNDMAYDKLTADSRRKIEQAAEKVSQDFIEFHKFLKKEANTLAEEFEGDPEVSDCLDHIIDVYVQLMNKFGVRL